MLKAIQILGRSSVLSISQRLTKTCKSSSVSFTSTPLNLSTFSSVTLSSPRRIFSFNPTRMSSSLPGSDPVAESPTYVSGELFGVIVPGYPEAQPDVIEANELATPESYQSDLAYLKKKIDAL